MLEPQGDSYMESIDNFRERFAALEQQTEHLRQQTDTLEAQTHTLTHQARWWRGMACGLGLLGLVSLPSGTAQEESAHHAGKGLAHRLEAVEQKLAHVTSGPDEVTITGANLRIVNGLGATDTINGLGNLIVGYNEPRGAGEDRRTGSHNVIVGEENNFISFGGVDSRFQASTIIAFNAVTLTRMLTMSQPSSGLWITRTPFMSDK